jgi:antitoxin ParD1/3/4
MTDRNGTTNASMNVSLPEGMKEYVRKRVAAGDQFTSPSDYVRALIRADQVRQQKLEALRRDVAVGLDELDRGQGLPAEEVFNKLEERFGRPE